MAFYKIQSLGYCCQVEFDATPEKAREIVTTIEKVCKQSTIEIQCEDWGIGVPVRHGGFVITEPSRPFVFLTSPYESSLDTYCQMAVDLIIAMGGTPVPVE